MRRCLAALLWLAAIAQPVTSQWFRANLSVNLGIALTAEPGFQTAASASTGLDAAVIIGKNGIGGVLEGGFVYQSPSAFTEDWYRYKGFIGLSLGCGLHYDLGPVDLFLTAGGQLSRYDHTDSYFWFPYVEPAVFFPFWRISRFFRLEAGLALPLYIRADCFTGAIQLALRISFIQGGLRAPRPAASPSGDGPYPGDSPASSAP